MNKLRTFIGLAIVAVGFTAAAAIFFYPVYSAFENHDPSLMCAVLVSWIPAVFALYLTLFIAGIIGGTRW